MQLKPFLIQYLSFSAGIALLVYLLQYIPALTDVIPLIWETLALFFLLSGLLYGLSRFALRSSDKNLFHLIAMSFNGLKILGVVVLVASHIELLSNGPKYFLIPFFLLYILFTTFEVYMLTKLSYMDS